MTKNCIEIINKQNIYKYLEILKKIITILPSNINNNQDVKNLLETKLSNEFDIDILFNEYANFDIYKFVIVFDNLQEYIFNSSDFQLRNYWKSNVVKNKHLLLKNIMGHCTLFKPIDVSNLDKYIDADIRLNFIN